MNKDAAERKGKRSEVNSVDHCLAMCALFHLMYSYQVLHHRSSGVNKYLDFFSIDLMLPPERISFWQKIICYEFCIFDGSGMQKLPAPMSI